MSTPLGEWVVAPYTLRDRTEWEQLVPLSGNGTFLHRRAFLEYHGARFEDHSLVVRNAAGRLVGLIPAARSLADPNLVISHPGATFGGLLTDPQITGGAYHSMWASMARAWRDLGFERLTYKATPAIYHDFPREEDLYVLWRLDACLTRRTLSACIGLKSRREPSSRRKRTLSKALRSGCAVTAGAQLLPDLWPLFEAVLRDRHHVQIVHSIAEIQDLARRLPDDIQVLGASIDGELVAGVVLFCSATVVHVQYSLSSGAGASIGAMDILIERSLEYATSRGARFLDLGISTEPSGNSLNEGLHQFKMEFGAGTVVYDQYEVRL